MLSTSAVLCAVWPEATSLGLNFLTCEMGKIRRLLATCMGVEVGWVSATGEGHGGVGLWTLACEDMTSCQGVDSAEWDGICSRLNDRCLTPLLTRGCHPLCQGQGCRWNEGRGQEGQVRSAPGTRLSWGQSVGQEY